MKNNNIVEAKAAVLAARKAQSMDCPRLAAMILSQFSYLVLLLATKQLA